MNLWLVRHGQTDLNKAKKMQGRSNMPLNETGIAQAKAAAEKAAGIHFDAVYASPLKRAVMTGSIISGIPESEITSDDRLIEADFGKYEGKPYHWMGLPMTLYWALPEVFPAPSTVETIRSMTNRSHAFLKELEQMPQYKSLRSNLAFCRMLRNLLSHYDWSKAGNDMVIVTDQAVRQVNNLYYSLNPVTLMRVAIRAGQIFAPSPEDSVLAAVKVMQRNDYSYIPIVENHRIVGVFSTKTLMRIVAEKGSALLSETLKFKDITEFTRLADESVAHYGFINPNMTVEDVSLKFQRSKSRRVRLDMLFITDNGRSDGTLQGMVTPVDILQ